MAKVSRFIGMSLTLCQTMTSNLVSNPLGNELEDLTRDTYRDKEAIWDYSKAIRLIPDYKRANEGGD